jgi:hypothetical protein
MTASSDSNLRANAGRNRRLIPMGVGKFSAVHFLFALVAMIFFSPFVDRDPFGDDIEAVLITVVMLSGVLAVGGRRKSLTAALLLVIPALICKWLDHLWPGTITRILAPVLSVALMGLLIGLLMKFVLEAATVTAQVLCAAVSAYISMGLLWSFAYVLVDRINPGSFADFGVKDTQLDAFEAFYFSFTTLISIGYGDITPVSRVAQMLAILEGMSGMLFVVTMISRLVSLYSPVKQRPNAE